MRSLFVSKNMVPWGPPFGARLRTNLIAATLAETGPVDLLLINSFAKTPPRPADVVFARTEMVQIPFMPDLSPQPMIDTQRVVLLDSLEHSHWIRNTEYDLVWYNRERTWLTTRGLLSAPAVVDVDDLEDVLLERWLEMGKTLQGAEHSERQRAAMTEEIRWWRATHQVVAKEADILVFVSETDRERFAYSANSVLVPNTYEPPGGASHESHVSNNLNLLFQGLMTWPANEDAAIWLADDIYPLIREACPSARLTLAGRPSPRVRGLADRPGISVPGMVPSMTPYLQASDLVVVPLRVGSGSRIKILEAFANQVPVVATSIAAEGLDAEDCIHIAIAETTSDIAQASITLLGDRSLRRKLADAAYEMYLSHYRASNAQQAIRQVITALRSA